MEQKLEEIWLDLDSYLFNFINKRVKNIDDSKDILQDVFLKVHSNIKTLKDETKINSWIFQITRNMINDFFRKNRKVISSEIEFDLIEEVREEETYNLSNCINRMIDSLPDNYRDAVYQTEIQGLSQIELSKKLDISYSGAKSRVQRGKEKLKELIQDCCVVSADKYGNIIEYYEKPKCGDCL